jgi:zinc/manganese transport system ATP-binding protein
MRRLGWHRAASSKELAIIRNALDAVGLSKFEKRSIEALSAGEFQRVLFARACVQDAPLILLDEPFSALDNRTISDLLSLIRVWRGEGRTIIAVLHDLDHVRVAFPETLLLSGQVIAWGPTEEVLTPSYLGQAHARGVIDDVQRPRASPAG